LSRGAGTGAGLRVGAWGWEHACWSGAFYPEGLPPEWRLAYYANAFRAVLIPAERLSASEPAEVAAWAAEVDPDFAFYAELAPAGDADLPGWLERIEPVGGALAGLVLAPQARALSDAGVRVLAARWPLTWVEPPASGGGTAASRDLAAVWRAGGGGGGCVGVLDGRRRTPRELRGVIEAFRVASGACAAPLLCFPGTAGAWQEMEQARLIASLLGS
jgi:hypothetical protein